MRAAAPRPRLLGRPRHFPPPPPAPLHLLQPPDQPAVLPGLPTLPPRPPSAPRAPQPAPASAGGHPQAVEARASRWREHRRSHRPWLAGMAAAAPAAPAPGAEFLEERLQRCAAIPPGERGPDVAAFVEGQRLLAECRALLLLTPEGRPALAPTPANRRQVLGGLLRFARAFYISPFEPPMAHGELRHLAAYATVALPLAGDASPVQLLAASVWAVFSTVTPGSFESISAALARLEDPSTAAELHQLLAQHRLEAQAEQPPAPSARQAAPPLLTLAQLQHVLSCSLVLRATTMIKLQGAKRAQVLQLHPVLASVPLLPPDHLRRLQAARQSAAERLLRLEPANPKSWGVAAEAAQDQQCAVERYLRAVELAQQQGSDWWVAQGSAQAMGSAGDALDAGAPRATAMAALAAAEQFQPALRRCKRLLPALWLQSLTTMAGVMPQAAAMVRLQLGLGQPGDQVLLSNLAAMGGSEPEQAMAGMRCTRCGAYAVGLRRCARCKGRGYCRQALRVLVAWASAAALCLAASLLPLPHPCPLLPPPSLPQPRVPGGRLAAPQGQVPPRRRLRPGAGSRQHPRRHRCTARCGGDCLRRTAAALSPLPPSPPPLCPPAALPPAPLQPPCCPMPFPLPSASSAEVLTEGAGQAGEAGNQGCSVCGQERGNRGEGVKEQVAAGRRGSRCIAEGGTLGA